MEVVSVGSYTSSPATVITVTNPCTGCEDGTTSLQVQVDMSKTTGENTADIGLVDNTLGSYTPDTQGAISTVTASANKEVTVTVGSGTGTNANEFHPLIVQDGIDYVAEITGTSYAIPGGSGPSLMSATLTASDFVAINLSTDTVLGGNPNFAGDTMTFGLVQFTTDSLSVVATNEYDALTFQLAQTPLPAALPLFAAGLGALGLLGWRRKRKAQAVAD